MTSVSWLQVVLRSVSCFLEAVSVCFPEAIGVIYHRQVGLFRKNKEVSACSFLSGLVLQTTSTF